jgi:hypothetical protein
MHSFYTVLAFVGPAAAATAAYLGRDFVKDLAKDAVTAVYKRRVKPKLEGPADSTSSPEATDHTTSAAPATSTTPSLALGNVSFRNNKNVAFDLGGTAIAASGHAAVHMAPTAGPPPTAASQTPHDT